MADLTQEEWQSRLAEDDHAVILDVRTPQEFEEGYIPDAVNIDIYLGQAFVEALDELDKSKHYYVYCRSGGRSGQACSLMNQMGFDTAYNLKGGILKWKGAITQ